MIRICLTLLAAAVCGFVFDRAFYPAWADIALNDAGCTVSYSEPLWQVRRVGLETTEVAISCRNKTVDRLHLIRVDQEEYKLSVHYSKRKPMLVEDWQRNLNATAVINGSFYLPDRRPETPIKSLGKYYGPKNYDSSHGALAIDDKAEILDLRDKAPHEELSSYQSAMVSYPLLLDAKQVTRAGGNPKWIANRTFVAIDALDRVILATTETGFFSLSRLGKFLETQPFGIQRALNLDGGPVASQLVRAGDFEKIVRGKWETNNSTTRVNLLAQQFRSSSEYWKLPIVLAVIPRRDLSDTGG